MKKTNNTSKANFLPSNLNLSNNTRIMKNSNTTFILALIVGLFLTFQPTDLFAQLTFTNKTTSDGLASNSVTCVFADGMNLYVGTFNGGLSISTDGGATFVNRTTANGLGTNWVRDVEVVGGIIYAGTGNGVSISTDGGATFVNRTTADGLNNNFIRSVFVAGSTIYVGTNVSDMSTSTDGGATFTTAPVGAEHVYAIHVVGTNVYLATSGSGSYISTDSGATYTHYDTSDGLGHINNDNLFIDEASQIVYIATRGGLSQATDTSIVLPAPPSNVPTLSQWGLIILALSLMTFGTLQLISRESGQTT